MKSIKVNSKQLESEVKQLMFDFFKVEITEKTDEQLLEYAKQCRFYRFPFTCITPETGLYYTKKLKLLIYAFFINALNTTLLFNLLTTTKRTGTSV